MNRTSAVDAAFIEGLIRDDRENKSFKVNANKLYTDETIFELEMQHIYEGNWIFLAHESQIREPNDYVSLYMGRQPVVLSRLPDGDIACVANRCTHRGARLCRAEKGNASRLRCPYHGWSFRNDGTLLGVPDREAYPSTFDFSENDLLKIRVESFKGFIFGSLNPDVIPLTDYLGNAKPYLELIVDKFPNGIEVAKGVTKYGYNGNWKIQAENVNDAYHGPFTHKSLFDVVQVFLAQKGGIGKDIKLRAHDDGIYLGRGHGVVTDRRKLPEYRGILGEKMFSDDYPDDWEERVGPVKAKWAKEFLTHMFIWPNLLILETPTLQFRVLRPLSPTQTEVRGYAYMPIDQPEEYTERQLRQYADFFGPLGNGTPDDLAIFADCTEGYQVINSPWNDLSRGIERETTELDLCELGPIEYASNITDDTIFRGMYRWWTEYMKDCISRGG